MKPSLNVLILALAALPALAQDVVVFRNGDRLTGTIKRLERGRLVLDAPALAGDAEIDWKRIGRVSSSRVFQFQTTGGENFLGQISPEESTPEEIAVEAQGVSRKIRQDDIVLVTQTVEGVGGLLEVSAGGGFSITRSNSQKQLNAQAGISYDTPSYIISGGLDSIFTTQKSTDDTSRHNVWARFNKKFRGKWGISALSDFLTSSQQKLDLRTILGGGPSYDVVRSNRLIIRAIGGAVWNNERFQPESGLDVNNEVEGLAAAEFSFFQFRQWNLDSTLFVFPSISSAGRIRMDWRTNLRFRLIRGKKIWWNLNGTVNLDNDPPSTAPGSDYVATTSISYDFP